MSETFQEYRLAIFRKPGRAWDLYGFVYATLNVDGSLVECGGLEELVETDPGVLSGMLLGMQRAFERRPIDLRGPEPRVCDWMAKT